VLKNRRYNLGHNFGHGKQPASGIFLPLNLLAFQFHTVLELCDGGYQKARASVGRKGSCFHRMQAALRYALHKSRRDFLIFVKGEDSDYLDGG
jgi:hypothetical protein